MFAPDVRNHNVSYLLLDRHIENNRGHAIAVIEPSKLPANYMHLGLTSNRIANYLHRRDVRVGQPIGLLLPDGQDFVFSFLACLKYGAVAVPLNTFSAEQALKQFLKDNICATIVTTRSTTHALRDFLLANSGRLSVIYLDDDGWQTQSAHFVYYHVTPDHPAFWLYTSGTEGSPKAVIHSHGSIAASLEGYPREVLSLTAEDRIFSTSKCFFAYGLGNSVLFPLAFGATAILDPLPTDPLRIAKLMTDFRPTVFFSVPTVYHRLIKETTINARALASVRICASAGEYLPTRVLSTWQSRTGHSIIDGLGTTEALHIFCSNRLDDLEPGTSGKPLSIYDVRIVDERGIDVADGHIGQLHVRGPTLSSGYWNCADGQRSSFKDGWLRTGDLYWRNSHGNFVYSGRYDDAFKAGGMWVTPAEIEAVLLSQPGVLEAAVVPGCRDGGLPAPKAFVVADPNCFELGSTTFVKTLIQALHDELPRYKVPRDIELVSSFPRTSNGKIARNLLRQNASTACSTGV